MDFLVIVRILDSVKADNLGKCPFPLKSITINELFFKFFPEIYLLLVEVGQAILYIVCYFWTINIPTK